MVVGISSHTIRNQEIQNQKFKTKKNESDILINEIMLPLVKNRKIRK